VRNEPFVLEDPAGTIRLLALAAQWPFTLAAMFDRLEDAIVQEEKGGSWPSGDPLTHLYTKVKPGLDLERQGELDRKLEDLDQLLTRTKGRLSWKALAGLRRYVVNFNPAVEEELRAAQLAAEVAARAARKTPSKRRSTTKSSAAARSRPTSTSR
jgi:hypothetical protein